MLRLVSVSLFAGTMLAVTPVAAQEQPPAPQQEQPQPAAPQPAPQQEAPQPAPQQAAPQQEAPQPAPQQAAPQQAAPEPAAPQQQQAMPEQGGAAMGNQFCSKDIQPMLVRREEIAKNLQAINKRGRPKTFEQAKKIFNDFCGSLGTYIANDQKLLDYMNKNKDFCAISDQNLQQISMDLKQTQATRSKICSHPPKQQAAPAPRGPGGQPVPKPPVDLKLQ
jgi:hypothetical protein